MNGLYENLTAFVETLPVQVQFFSHAVIGVLIYLLGESVGTSVGKAVYNFSHS